MSYYMTSLSILKWEFKILLFRSLWKKLQISDSQAEAQRDGVRIPMTESEYCLKPRATSDHDLDFDMDDDDDEDFYDDDDECCYESSGQFTLLLKKL